VAIVYFDASAHLTLLLEEPDRPLARATWDECDLAVSSRSPRRTRGSGPYRRLGCRGLEAALDQWERFWLDTRTIELSDRLVRRAGRLAGDHALTGADAVHLASAEALSDVVVATWDRRLGRAASRVGLDVVPAA
jgi:predicted nucleic acid-binding protein